VPAIGPVLGFVTPSLLDAVAGVIAGALALLVVMTGGKLLKMIKKPS
jgi:hypothetical protein